MTSARKIILEIVCPSLGVIMANIMFSAPYRAVREAVRKGSLGELNPVPWAFMTGNCTGWLAYSFLTRDFYLFFANAPPLILSIWFNLCAVKLEYADYQRKQHLRQSFVTQYRSSQLRIRRESMRRLHAYVTESENEENPLDTAREFGKEVVHIMATQHTSIPVAHEKKVLGIILIWVALISLVAFAERFSNNTRKLIIGIAVNCNLVFFFGGPLWTISTVLRTRNSSTIHIWTMITNTVNASFWTCYGFAVLDPFVFVPNGLGTLLGVVQIFLVMSFPRKPKDDLEEALESITEDVAKSWNHRSDRMLPRESAMIRQRAQALWSHEDDGEGSTSEGSRSNLHVGWKPAVELVPDNMEDGDEMVSEEFENQEFEA